MYTIKICDEFLLLINQLINLFRLTGTQLVFEELFNTIHLADNLEHLRKTLPRFGHSLSADRRGSLWMFGGYSLSHGPLNDIRLFDTRNITWMQVTVDSTPDAKMPQGRYFHGADVVHSKQAIFIYGGLTKSPNRTLDDFWRFDIQNQRWREIEQGETWPGSLAGHTLTSYRNATAESLILIGGISPQFGLLNSIVWEYKFERNEWELWKVRGRGPLGLYGHTTVFHFDSNSLYVFGGYVFNGRQAILTNNLYMLNYETRTWTELNAFSSSLINLPSPRFLHTAVTTDTHMIVLGGRISPWNISDTLYAFSYNCNRWINLMTNSVEKVGPLPNQTYAHAMTIDPEGDTAYIIGGYGGDSHFSVFRLQLPQDLCSLWPNRQCLEIPGCGYCAFKYENITLTETCHSNFKECPLVDVVNRTKHSNPGTICEGPVIYSNCSSPKLQQCSTCVRSVANCKWCGNKCSNKCDEEEEDGLTTVMECPFNNCSASDCEHCKELKGCYWSGAACLPNKRGTEDLPTMNKPCKTSCMKYDTCSDCLDSVECRWSTQLDKCLSSSYQPLYCAGGVCGLVLRSKQQQECPEPCKSFTQCSSCLRHAHCGWCASPGLSGNGFCTEGSNERPMQGTCDDVSQELRDIVSITYN